MSAALARQAAAAARRAQRVVACARGGEARSAAARGTVKMRVARKMNDN